MGKSKAKKDIFKVAGAQSLKVKTKAKPVKLNLKQLAPKLKSKTLELDSQLIEVRPLLTNPKEEKPVQKLRQTPQIVISKPPLTVEEEKNALERLTELQCK